MKITLENGMYVVSGNFNGRRYITYAPTRSEAMSYAYELMGAER